ncbi:MAG TPA: TIGR01777 family oxidoreductase [Pirellulales bacterium]|nr:TIGR01777 family oxidoreductase [Pirellulales bacterium]
MKILVSGASGLVGSSLVPTLIENGHDVARLVRERAKVSGNDVLWDPAAGSVDPQALEPFDAVVNLAGENIAAGRWTAKQKARIRDSRVKGTSTLSAALAQLPARDRMLINASAIGFYGSRPHELLDEASSSGEGFLCDVCRDWERATEPAAKAGLRVVLARFGVVLSGRGGALAKMLLPFRLGLGGKIGNGDQYMSWVALDDVVGAIVHCLHTPGLQGPINVVAPQPVTNLEFTKTLGSVLKRPTVFPLPALVARVLLGQMADELLLASQRVAPKRLESSGYEFRYAQLAAALGHVLGKR